MIPYDIDPSLHTAEPVPTRLDDGFSPRPHDEPPGTQSPLPADADAQGLGDKSPF